METRKRLDHLDLLKAYAILAVIVLHTELLKYDISASPCLTTGIEYALRLLSEGVPIFLIVNGFLLLRKESVDYGKHFRKTAKIFGILVLWAVILGIFGFYMCNPGQSLSFSELWGIVTGVSLGSAYNGVLWFLVYLVQVYLLYPVIWKIYHSDFRLFLYFFGIAAFFAVGINTYEVVRDFLAVWFDVAPLDQLDSFLQRFTPFGYVWYIYYFMLGGIFWHFYDRMKEKRVILGAAALISWLVMFAFCCFMSLHFQFCYRPSANYDTIFAQVFFIGIFAFTIPYENRSGPVQKLIASVGKNTMGMYLSHFLFIYLFDRYLPMGDGFSGRILNYVLVVACSYIFAVVTTKIPGVKKLVTI